MLSLGKTSFFRLLKENQLPRTKVGSKTLIPVEALKAFAGSLLKGAA